MIPWRQFYHTKESVDIVNSFLFFRFMSLIAYAFSTFLEEGMHKGHFFLGQTKYYFTKCYNLIIIKFLVNFILHIVI